MRAREFTINIPINIKLNSDGEPEIGNFSDSPEPEAPDVQQSANRLPPRAENELDLQPMMVPPLQQDIEIKKAAIGKTSPVIQKLTRDETEAPEPTPISSRFQR